MPPLALVVALLLCAKLLAEISLLLLNRREIRRHAGSVPTAFSAIMDDATYAKATAYSLEKNAFAILEELFGFAVLSIAVFGGFLPWTLELSRSFLGSALWADALWLIAIGTALTLPGLPLDWWSTFRLEAKFGFNRSTLAIWISDKFKSVALAVVIGFPLIWLILALVGWAGDTWWLWAFALLIGFQLLMLVLYPKLILPLFNKLTPLPEGELRAELLSLADRTGFHAQTIEVMDGSKRSGHSNAFFTGFGRFRRIVLFDTLIEQLTRTELAAVLAHEIGHYKRGHIPKTLLLSALIQLAGLATIGWLSRTPAFLQAFGFDTSAGLAPLLLLFSLLAGAATFWISPLLNALSRKHEYEADAFARDALASAEPIVNALRKLAGKNLTNLTPHPWYSFFYYSHPTLFERERAVAHSQN